MVYGTVASPNGDEMDQREDHIGSTHNGVAQKPSRVSSSGSESHTRSLSGSILSKLSFLRASSDPNARAKTTADEEDSVPDDDATPKRSNAMASAMRETKSRKRKGSLRKKAILGTGKLKLEGRERRNSILESPKKATPFRHNAESNKEESKEDSNGDLTPRRFSYESPVAASSSETGWPLSPPLSHKPSLKPASTSQDEREDQDITITKLPLANPSSYPYTSTTDDDDGLTFSVPSSGNILLATSKKSSAGPISAPGTYYGPQTHTVVGSGPRRRTSHKAHAVHAPHTSPLSHPPLAALEDEWDYSETEWWGWVVLIVTWLVFVVGMGSCLGVWSWAWDVGETPYAPPELEDDPTLPIVGYYPALIVMTGVMAWVWVVVAWVGMKYFRHAKVVAD